MKTKKIAYFALSTLTLCVAIIGLTYTNNTNDDLAIQINPTNYVHKSIGFNEGIGQYVSNSKAKVDETKNSIRFISAVKVDMNDNNELSLPGTFGFHIEYEKTIDGGTTKVDKMFDVDALYYSYSETDTNRNKTIYGTELSSYYNNHVGAEFKAISEYINDSSTSYNLFMTVEIRNIPTSDFDKPIKVQPYCLLKDGTYDLAKETKYYTFNDLSDVNLKIKVNSVKTEVVDNTPYFIINSSIKNVTYDQLYLLLELQEGWPHPTYTLRVNKSTANNDNTTNLYINLDQTLSDGSMLKAGDYIMDLKNDINDDSVRLTNNINAKVASSSSKSIYEFGELYGNLKLNVTRYSESQIVHNSYRVESKNDKDYLIVNSYLFIDDVSKLTFKVTKFTNWAFENKTCTYSLLNDGSYDVYLDITNLEYDSKTSDNLYGGYLLELGDGSLSKSISYSLPHENSIVSGKYMFDEIWGSLKLHIVDTNTIEYNSYKLENVNNRAILTINANANIADINELIFKFTKFQTGDWANSNANPLSIEKQSNGSFNVTIDISDLDICGKTSDDKNEGYLVTLKTSSIDNGSISLGTAPETITIGDRTYSFEDQWGNLKIVINNAN